MDEGEYFSFLCGLPHAVKFVLLGKNYDAQKLFSNTRGCFFEEAYVQASLAEWPLGFNIRLDNHR